MFGSNSDIHLLTRKKVNSFSYIGDIFQNDDYKLQHDVVIFENFITEDFCNKFLDFFSNRQEWRKSVTYGEIDSGMEPSASPRQSWEISMNGFPCADKIVHSIFNRGICKYREIYEHVEITADEGYNLLRYQNNGEYTAHTDRGSRNNRVVSGLIYLNGDFSGGELHFPRYDFMVKPQKGMLVLFPSWHTHLHAAMPVTDGTKYAIVTWFV
jgi:hypothetical protein